ncbi:MAG: hypothetical protein RMM31_11310, partial [Anaerolineae bacterium]|nr:hypothetical protein [Anaerolineae bacterium]
FPHRKGFLSVIHRQTQTPEYWAAFSPNAEDINHIYSQIVEAGKPVSIQELAVGLIRWRMEQEAATLRQQFANDKVYQPKQRYAVGETLAFPALRFARGRVVNVRPGHNPELGNFEVIEVEMTDGRRRQFAAAFTHPHRLNEEDFTRLLDAKPILSAEALYQAYGEHIAVALNEALAQNAEFVRVGDKWFVREMMVEVGVGYLNLAEAALDMAGGGPLKTSAILHEIGFPQNAPPNVQQISLNMALYADERFDEVGYNDKPAWFLRRLEPPEVLQTPALLTVVRSRATATLDDDLLRAAQELDDEWELELGEVRPAESVEVILTPSHRLAGTLGWSCRVASLLPYPNKPRASVRFIDAESGSAMVVWLVRDGRYVWGLREWYDKNDLPAGAYIRLRRGDREGTFVVDYRRRRPHREWVRVAVMQNGRLGFETAQRTLRCEVDDLMAVFMDNPPAIAEARLNRPRDVAQAVREVFPELVRLNPQGNVHGRTLYAAANVLVRCTPRDVFATLVSSNAYVLVGDNYWRMA